MITNPNKGTSNRYSSHAYYGNSSAAPVLEPLPEIEIPAPKKKKLQPKPLPAYRIKKVFLYQVMFLAIIAAFAGGLIINSYQRLSAATYKASNLQLSISSIDQDIVKLEADLSRAIDTATLKQKASKDLNMGIVPEKNKIIVDYKLPVSVPALNGDQDSKSAEHNANIASTESQTAQDNLQKPIDDPNADSTTEDTPTEASDDASESMNVDESVIPEEGNVLE